MTTVRIARRRQFLRMDSRAVNDPGLSFRARGVLAWLLDKPDNWTVNADAIANQGSEGRDAIRRALRELEAAGYLVRSKRRAASGQWESEATVYEHPDQSGKPAQVDERWSTSGDEPGLLLNLEIETKTKPKDEAAEAARALVQRVWDARDPKPATPFIAAVKIAEKLLAAGHAPEAVEAAMREVPTISTGWLEGQLNKRPTGRPARPADDGWDRDAPGGVLTDAELWAHADKAAGT